TRPRIDGSARTCTMAVAAVMKAMLQKPTNNANGNATAIVGAAANTNMATPNPKQATTTSRTPIDERCAAASAPVNEPTLSTEYKMVNVPSVPCSVRSANNGSTTEKLKVNVPTTVAIISGIQRSRTVRM